MTVRGTKRTVVWDDLDQQQTLSVYDRGGDLDLRALGVAERPPAIMTYRLGDTGSRTLSERGALAAMACEFADSIHQLRARRTGGEAGLRVLSVLEAASRSLATVGKGTRRRPGGGTGAFMSTVSGA